MNCTCKSYAFPHRPKSGRCMAGAGSLFCGACGDPCEANEVDQGIGAYEAWGRCGVDTCMATVSDCCEADVFENASLTIPYELEAQY